MRIPPFVLFALTLTTARASAQARRDTPRATAPAHTASAPTVQVAWLRGRTEVTVPAGNTTETHVVRVGDELPRGARLRVQDGTIELSVGHGTAITLQEGASLMLFGSPSPPPAGQAPSTTTTLLRGVLRASAHGDNAPLFPLATTSTTVFLGRGDGVVAAEVGGQVTRIAAHRGRLRVRASAREYILRAGNGVVEELGRPRMPFRQLPPSPVWTTPPPERIVSTGEPIEVNAAWGFRTAATAAHWRVQLARDEHFRDVLSSERVPATVTRWTGRGVEPGTYYLRVAALDPDRFEGPPSAVARVVVAAPHLVDSEAATEEHAGRLARVEVPEGFYCGLDGARMSATNASLRLVPGREHHLRCATRSDGSDARDITIDSARAGVLQHELRQRTVAWNEGVLGLSLRDAEGQPVPYADVRVANDDGVVIEPVRESRDRGVYNAAVHWPRGVTRTRLRITINETVHFEEELRQ